MKKYIGLTGIIFAYSILFQLSYNWMVYLTPWPYEEFSQVTFSFVCNFIPMWLLAVMIWVEVWHIPVPGKSWVKISADVILCIASLFNPYIISNFKAVTGMTSATFRRNS